MADLVGRCNPARLRSRCETASEDGKRFRIRVSGLDFKLLEIETVDMETRWSPGLQAHQFETQIRQAAAELTGGGCAFPATLGTHIPGMHEPPEERSGTEDHP